VRAPIHGASSRVEGENIELGGADQSVIHHDQTGLKGSELIDVVRAQNFQLANILRIDLAQLRETLRRECSIVTRPVSGGARQWRHGGRRGCDSLGAFVSRIHFRRRRARRGKPRNKIIARQARKCGYLDRVSVVQRPCYGRAYHSERGSDDEELLFHTSLHRPLSMNHYPR
jgi:hypothetical protein